MHQIHVPLENEAVYEKYHPFFQLHGYEGNGYCWEGHIIQILEKEDEDLLNKLEFDSEAGAFYAYADTEKAQLQFARLMHPIFSDLDRLEKYVDAADPDRIDD